jgi:hypothetical protein
MDPARSAKPREHRVDLRELRSPDVVEVVAHRALEVVAGPRLLGKEAQENVGKRHGETISK